MLYEFMPSRFQTIGQLEQAIHLLDAMHHRISPLRIREQRYITWRKRDLEAKLRTMRRKAAALTIGGNNDNED